MLPFLGYYYQLAPCIAMNNDYSNVIHCLSGYYISALLLLSTRYLSVRMAECTVYRSCVLFLMNLGYMYILMFIEGILLEFPLIIL